MRGIPLNAVFVSVKATFWVKDRFMPCCLISKHYNGPCSFVPPKGLIDKGFNENKRVTPQYGTRV